LALEETILNQAGDVFSIECLGKGEDDVMRKEITIANVPTYAADKII